MSDRVPSPTSKNAQKVAEVFLKASDYGVLKIRENCVWTRGGSVLTGIGGHYVVATRGDYFTDQADTRGKVAMSEDLETGIWWTIQAWAEQNPLTWGNEHGYNMFTSPEAYGKEAGDRLTLNDVGEHWLKVADNLAQTELVIADFDLKMAQHDLEQKKKKIKEKKEKRKEKKK